MSPFTLAFSSLCALVGAPLALSAPASAGACASPGIGSDAAPMVSPPRSAVVVGTGRLQIYSAPNPHCPISGTFIIPRNEVVVYAETNDGWSSVVYFGARNPDDFPGWVRSSRLELGGTMGPSP